MLHNNLIVKRYSTQYYYQVSSLSPASNIMGNIATTPPTPDVASPPPPPLSERPASTVSRHSPPASRGPGKSGPHHLEDVGSLGEIWTNRDKWEDFKSWLRLKSEGETDSEGEPLSLERFAIFLELYVSLDQQFRSQPDSEHCLNLVVEIETHREQFLGRERCLDCIDAVMRKTTLERIKNVREGKEKPSPAVFAIVYQRVVDKLSELLGSYQNSLLEQEKSRKK